MSSSQRFREKVKVGKIRDRLEKCALGKEEMTSNELTAARILLNKAVPDLKSLEIDQTTTFSGVEPACISNSALISELLSRGTVEADDPARTDR